MTSELADSSEARRSSANAKWLNRRFSEFKMGMSTISLVVSVSTFVFVSHEWIREWFGIRLRWLIVIILFTIVPLAIVIGRTYLKYQQSTDVLMYQERVISEIVRRIKEEIKEVNQK